ncbi:reverse transcriptase domain-containing protein [Tanacetum coccineum]
MEDTMLDLLEICRQKELYCIHNNVDDLFKSALNSKLLSINLNSQHLDKEKQEESIISLNNTPQISLVNAITHDLPTVEPEDSLIMRNEELSTIPEKESDEFIKFSVEDLILISRESEDTSGSDGENVLPSSDEQDVGLWDLAGKAEKLSCMIKELKQSSGKDQPKAAKKGETSGKDKPLEILMDPFRSKKPNGSSYRTPHWFQRRNHMANGTNIAASKNRGCGVFNFYMDEFCGGKTTISVQWDHMKANGEENSSSPANSSQNVKIPSFRRNTHSTEQQDNTTRMHDGHNLPPSLKLQKKGSKGFVTPSGASPERTRRMPSSQTKEKKPSTGKEQGNTRGSSKTCRRQNNKGSPLPQLVVKSCNDDLVIKSRTEQEIMRDIEETFRTLREINMKLNPKICTFGVDEGMFLGYKSAEKSLPFFKALKKCIKKSNFQWTMEAEAAFKQMKKLIAELPTLTAPIEKKELIVYLAATREAISAVLMTEKEAKQMPVYFVRRVMQGEYDIQYRPRTSVKGQILADFIVERPEDDSLVMTTFDATNNEAEYEALISGLRIIEQMGIKNLQANVDSRLVANQVNGSYIVKESCMIQYLKKVKTLSSSFKKFSIKQVPRSENKNADALSKIMSTTFAHLTKQVLVEELNEKSINEAEVLAVVEEEGDTWMTQIYEYLTEEVLPAKKEKARAVRRKSRRYVVINGVLYKKSYLALWLRYVGPLQADYVLRKIHEGSYSMHADTRYVVAKAIRT